MGKDTRSTILNQKHSQRDAFWKQIAKEMANDEDIVIVVADMSSPAFDEIRVKFPHRFINVGIAEQNAVSIAAGLAREGKKVYVYAIASFIALRCYEQIRINCSIMNLPINIVAVGAGFSYDDSGPTHHLFEDITVMRVLPNITIHSIADNETARLVAMESVKHKKPRYIRLERHVAEDIYEFPRSPMYGWSVFSAGDNSDKVLVSTGYMTRVALDVQKSIDRIDVIDVNTLPLPYDDSFSDLLNKYAKVFTLEEGFLPGGLGSYILEILNDNGRFCNVKRIGMKPEWIYRYGGREDNQTYHGIDKDSVIREICGGV